MTPTGKEAERAWLARTIASAGLFARAGESDVSELARYGRSLAVQRGRQVAAPKGRPEEIFIIAAGAAALLERGGVLTALMGPGDVIGLVRAAEILGETGAQHSGEWRALSNLSLIAIPTADFLRVMRRSEELSAASLSMLARHVREMSARHAAALQSPLEARLAALLSQLATIMTGNRWEPQANIGRMPQTMLADMLGVSREHVNRTLTMWERSSLILQAKGGDLIIENRKRLAQLAGDGAQKRPLFERDAYWEIEAHINLGLNSAAFDLAMEGVKRAPRDDRFKYFAALAMARMGALSEAIALVDAFRLSPDSRDEDVASIGPRLRRDLAFAAGATPDLKELKRAAQGYEKAFDALGATYPGVNAAATWAMSGDSVRATALAKKVRAIAETAIADIDVDEAGYWPRATLAECRLLEGDIADAAAAFAAAVVSVDAAPGKIATTRKQLRRLSATLPIDADWIDKTAPQRPVLFFCGPLATSDERTATIKLKDEISEFLDGERPLAAIGALAAGADIVIAEALIEAGTPLHVHLPLAPTEFLAKSVEPAGKDWRERFIACVEAAQTVEWTRRLPASRAAYRLAAHVAMGRAIRQADDLAAEAIGFFAVQRGRNPADSISLENAEIWKRLGRRLVIVEDDWPAPISKDKSGSTLSIFPALVVEGGKAEAVDPIVLKTAQFALNNLGLVIYAFRTPSEAAEAARAIAASAEGAKRRLWLDIGLADAGDVGTRARLSGTLVTAACRPQTPPGRVYASDSFVGAAAATPGHALRFDYVGVTPTAEKLDPCPLYLAHV